jgi:hypothetical protein
MKLSFLFLKNDKSINLKKTKELFFHTHAQIGFFLEEVCVRPLNFTHPNFKTPRPNQEVLLG